MKRFLSGIFVIGLSACGNAQQAEYPQIHVGPNVQVSSDRPTADHVEVWIDADPANANNLTACSYAMLGSPVFHDKINWLEDSFYYVSKDGGATWHHVYTSGDSAVPAGDPICAFGKNSTLYALALHNPDLPGKPKVLSTEVSRSPDLGAHWEKPLILPFIDREFIAFDRTGGRYNGRIYLSGTGPPETGKESKKKKWIAAATLFRSLDDGKTFSSGVVAPPVKGHWLIGSSNSVILSNGAVLFAFPEQQKTGDNAHGAMASLKLFKTVDGGVHLNSAGVIAPYQFCDGAGFVGGAFHPQMAVDTTHGPFRDRVYVAYPGEQDGRCVISVATSKNAGKTWSAPVMVDADLHLNANGDGPNSSLPAIAVNENGVVGVVWHDRRIDPQHDLSHTLQFAASIDGGDTFTPSIAVSNAANTISWNKHMGAPQVNITQAKGSSSVAIDVMPQVDDIDGGDTAGLTADRNGVFHALWPDNRDGVGQLWTAPISVDAAAAPNGDPALAKLRDVSHDVSLEVASPAYDPATHSLSMSVALANTSKHAISGPFSVRILRLQSKYGDITSRTNDVSSGATTERRSAEGGGAVWILKAPNGASSLAPKQLTAPRTIVFDLTNLRPMSNQLLKDFAGPDFVTLQAKILAR